MCMFCRKSKYSSLELPASTASAAETDSIADSPTAEQDLTDHLSTEKKSSADVIRLLLPGLCHLTADEEARHVCLESQLHHLLIDYITSFCTHLLDDAAPDVEEETLQSIVTSCSVLLNIVVSEPVLQTEDSIFENFLSFLVQTLPDIGKPMKAL